MIASKLAELRKTKGWTQMDLSIKTGIPRAMISRYEKGQIPGKTKLSDILKAFDLPNDYFYKIAVENQRPAIQSFDPITSRLIDDILELPKDEQRIVYAMVQSIKEKYGSKKGSTVKKNSRSKKRQKA